MRAACIYDSLGSRLAAAVITLMHDKVLNMIRETLVHENSVEQFSFDFGRSVARLDLSQPREDEDYPDYSLRLTFSGGKRVSWKLCCRRLPPMRTAGHRVLP